MAKKEKFTEQDDELLAALGIEVEKKKPKKYTKQEERIIAGFEEIQKFVEDHGHLPRHGEDKDIFERLYAVRLEQISKLKEHRELLDAIDHQQILSGNFKPETADAESLSDDELLAELGVDADEEESITKLKHVKSRSQKKAMEEMANRTECEDFEKFEPLFNEVKKEIDTGYRSTIRFRKDSGFTKTSITEGQFVILGGQLAYIAEIGKTFKAPNGEDDARLRVIYDNGTESNILLRSLIRAMYKDETSRFVLKVDPGPLFSSEHSTDDLESGTIYVLRSKSDHPTVKSSRDVIHKIGITGGDVNKRVANAKNDPTFLMAEVEVVATYKLANINRVKLEKLIHKFFSSVQLEIEITDRFGKPVKAREWFLVPIFVIDEMMNKIIEGKLNEFYYNSENVKIEKY